MTVSRPRFDTWWGKVIVAVFLLFVGGIANQFLNIPAQQMHQDDRLDALERMVKPNTTMIQELKAQHMLMISQQVDQARKIEELERQVREMSDRLDDHDRRTRSKHK